jgi:ribokinase
MEKLAGNQILVVGSLNMDLVVRTAHHPEPGETVIGSDFHTFPGGKGANQAVTSARLGAQVKMIGRVGADAFGETLLRTVAQAGVDTRYISQDAGISTGIALITLDKDGSNTIVLDLGANARLTPQEILDAEPAFKDARVLVTQLEIPLETTRTTIEIARKYNLPIILNPAPAQGLDIGSVAGIDYLIPNQNELQILAGTADVHQAAKILMKSGVVALIVTLGEGGVLVMEGQTETLIPAYHVPVVDTVGAGDAFVGAFAVALTEGKTTLQAAAFGNAAGALCVTRSGAQPSLPTRAEIEQFLASVGKPA